MELAGPAEIQVKRNRAVVGAKVKLTALNTGLPRSDWHDGYGR